ncbi:MAG: polysaccharide biosynthesis tyrosine autokinase [Lachnospiraceae bacterium]|nr:polysaccharide biosynthesis tyrosine autokinase [Lachnospiraceae bacterium]
MTNETQSLIQSRNDNIDYGIVLDDMLKCFFRNWWKILAIISMSCLVAYISAKALYRPVYSAASTFVVSSNNTGGYDRNQYNSTVTSQLGNVFPYLLKSDLMTKLVAEDLGTDSIPGTISAEALPGTSLITLTAKSGDAQLSYDILQSVVKNYPEVSAYVIGDVKLDFMDETGIPENPSNPPRFRMVAAIAGALAAMAAVILLFLYAVTRLTVRSEKDLKILFNIPALGSVPRVHFKKRSGKKEHRIAVDEKNIPYFFIESFRTIRNRLEKEVAENQLQTILVTSALPSEGKSTVAANLAVSLSHKDRSVILVDLDLRNPSADKVLRIEKPQSGVSEVLRGEAKLKDVLISYGKKGNLRILPGHGSISNPSELLNAEILQKLMAELKKEADFILIDTPPSAIVSDASIIAKYVDGGLFVVRQDYAKLDSLQEGMEMLAGTGLHVIGTILNGTESSVFSGGYGYGYYQYGHYGRYGYSGKYGYYGGKNGYGYGYGEKTESDEQSDESMKEKGERQP